MTDYDPLLYALVHTGTPGDVAFYVERCRGARRVLELGCGFGRLLTELAGEASEVVGLDRDPGLLALARAAVDAAPEPARARVSLVSGDMRAFELPGSFDRVLIPHSGLYCLQSESDVAACLACVFRHLSPGGRLVMDAYAADGFHDECVPEDYPEDRLEEVALIAAEGVVYDVFERSCWERDAQRMVATYVHVPDGGGAPREYAIAQRYLLRPQLERMLTAAGLRLLSFEGDFAGSAYDADSDQWAIVAERPA